MLGDFDLAAFVPKAFPPLLSGPPVMVDKHYRPVVRILEAGPRGMHVPDQMLGGKPSPRDPPEPTWVRVYEGVLEAPPPGQFPGR